jgi:hypothetical protein
MQYVYMHTVTTVPSRPHAATDAFLWQQRTH